MRAVQKVTLGRGGPEVSRAGLGLMGMSGIYGPADEDESVATIRAALDAGITLLDTGDFYGMGHNELLLARVLREVPRDRVFVQVKFGGMRDPRGAFIGHDARPAAVKNFLAYSLTRLGTDYIDLYQPARLDPHVPIEDTVGAIGEMIDAGYVRYVGLSEVGAETIRRAHAVRPVAELQIEYSLMSRGIEREILPCVRELGISVTAYGIMSRGLLNRDTARLADGDPRARFPRFQQGNLERNLALLDALEKIARAARGEHRPAGHRLGGRPGRGHHPADRHQAAVPAGRGHRRPRPAAVRGRAGRDRGRGARGAGGWHPVRRAADGRAGQRALAMRAVPGGTASRGRRRRGREAGRARCPSGPRRAGRPWAS